MIQIMSPDRHSSQDGSNKIIAQMSLDRNHIILQQQQQQYTTGNIILNKNGILSLDTALNNNNINMINHNTNAFNGLLTTNSSPTMASSKYVVLSDLTENYIKSNDHHHNEIGNIVLLATEQLEPSDNEQNGEMDVDTGGGVQKVLNGDEELTPLNWLNDKNLLKGINLSCPKGRSSENGRQVNGDSDSVDDSGVSEDNNSSVNSSSEQSIGLYSSETSPKSVIYLPSDAHSNNNKVSTNHTSSHSIVTSSGLNNQSRLVNVTSYVSNAYIEDLSMQSPISSSTYAKSQTQLNSPNGNHSNAGNHPTPHQHFHKKYLREQTLKEQQQQQNHQTVQFNLTPSQPSIIRSDQIVYSDDKEYLQGNYEYEFQPKIEYSPQKASYSSASSTSSSSSPSPKQKHSTNAPYDPLVHTTSKPPYSFSSLIFMAIEDSVQKALPVKEIYAWIVQHFPYFKTAPTGWKNSVRHNLSLNKCFQKVEKAANLGKGSLWMVEPQYRPNLIQALTRSPFHPCSTLDKVSFKSTPTKVVAESPPPAAKSSAANNRLPNPEHFPYLSKRLAAMESYSNDEDGQSRCSTPNGYDSHGYAVANGQHYYGADGKGTIIYHNNNSIILNGNLHSPEIIGRDIGADTIEDVNAATAMLALKHGPKIFTESFHPPVITTSPSEDHTYSAGNGQEGGNGTENQSSGTSSDAAYESSEESQVINAQELEEQRRQAEGVDALLNLAGYSTNTTLTLKRPLPSTQMEKKQYYYTTEIAPNSQPATHVPQPRFYYNGNGPSDELQPPPAKRLRNRSNKLKKKSWFR